MFSAKECIQNDQKNIELWHLSIVDLIRNNVQQKHSNYSAAQCDKMLYDFMGGGGGNILDGHNGIGQINTWHFYALLSHMKNMMLSLKLESHINFSNCTTEVAVTAAYNNFYKQFHICYKTSHGIHGRVKTCHTLASIACHPNTH
jgi:hypothetical protein